MVEWSVVQPPMLPHNFLHPQHLPSPQRVFSCTALFLLFCLAVGLVLSTDISTIFAVTAIGATVIIFFAFYLEWGLYLLTATTFLLGWVFVAALHPSLRDLPYLAAISAPVGDLIAVGLVICILAAVFLRVPPYRCRTLLQATPGMVWYGAFIVTAIISVFFAYDHDFGIGVKYLAREMIFPYVAFVFVPAVIIWKKQTLDVVLQVLLSVGVFTAVFGLSSIWMTDTGLWFRLAPYSLHGFTPFGFNQNQLAEPLVVITPIAAYFFLRAKTGLRLKWGGALALIVGAALLTLSRAAWIALFIELIVGVELLYPGRAWQFVRKHLWHFFSITIILLPIFFYMGFFLQSSVVAFSNASRVAAIDVAMFYVPEAPFFGHGPGTYLAVLSNTFFFTSEFGDPLDAHGFVQKILLEEGIIGLIFFVGFLGYVFRRLYRAQKTGKGDVLMQQMLLLSVTGIVLVELVNTGYFHSVMWLPIGIALAACNMKQVT